MSTRWRIAWFTIAVLAANILDQSVMATWQVRPLDLTVVVLMLGTMTGLVWPAVALAVLAGLFRSTTTVFPWFAYGLAYLVAIGTAWLVIRRVVAERSVASLLAASLSSSVAYAVALGGIILVGRMLDPRQIQLVWPASLWSGLIQVLAQPLVVLFLWRVTGGGKFATVQESLTRPF